MGTLDHPEAFWPMYWDPGGDASRGKGGCNAAPAFLRYWQQIIAPRAGAVLDELGITAEE